MTEKHHKAKVHTHREKESGYLLPAALVLALVLVTNAIVVSQSNKAVDDKLKYAGELTKPASLEAIEINTAQCADCFDISGIISALKQFKASVNEKSIDSTSLEAKKLIENYNISKLPTVIITGETEKAGLDAAWSAVGTKEKDGALVLRIGAPFVEMPSGEVRGRPELVLLSYPPCTGCYNVTQHEGILKAANMVFSKERTVDGTSTEGKALIAKYNITKVPTALISPDAKYYDFPTSVFGGSSVRDGWKIVGSVESDGWYIFRNIDALRGAVYYDLRLKKMVNQTAG